MELYAGFDLGGTQLKYGLIDMEGIVLQAGSADSPKSGDELFKLIRSIFHDLKTDNKDRIKAAGFGFPGIFHQREQKIIQSPNYPSLDGKDLVSHLSPFIDIPFFLGNEANFAAYAEFMLGAGQGATSLVLLTIGTGIGTGIILEGKILQGACGFAGELGHVPIHPEGTECRCGSRGCLETKVSAPKIVRSYRTLSNSAEDIPLQDVFRRAEKGDSAARKAVAQAGYFLGIGLSLAINFLNPDQILLGGGVMESGDLLISPALEEARRRSFPASFECCRIERAKLGNKAGFIGAALWAREVFRQERR
ncbi:MAG: ROK family protein [Candidatus Aminicenantes bacterium]|nr:ROK family protein [Candidatus Aminicenantes bacterium]